LQCTIRITAMQHSRFKNRQALTI